MIPETVALRDAKFRHCDGSEEHPRMFQFASVAQEKEVWQFLKPWSLKPPDLEMKGERPRAGGWDDL